MYFDNLLLCIKESIAAIGVLIISIGAVRSIYQLILLFLKKNMNVDNIRLQFGNSVVLGLEFMVAGDIIGSLVKPDYYNLGMLAIIVAIRTVLSFFLNLELAALTPEQKEGIK